MTDNYECAIGPNVAVVKELTGQDNTIQLLGKLRNQEKELLNVHCQLALSNKQLDMEREEFHEYSMDLKAKLKAAEARIEADKLQQNKDRDSYLSVVEILQATQKELETVTTSKNHIHRILTEELNVVRHSLVETTKVNIELQQTVKVLREQISSHKKDREEAAKITDKVIAESHAAHAETRKKLDALNMELQSVVRCKQEVEAEAVLLDAAVIRQREKRVKEKEGHDIVVKYLVLNIDELRETKQRLRDKVAKLKQQLENDEMPPLIQVR